MNCVIFLLNILTITDKVVRVCKIILCENRFVAVNYGLYSIRYHFRTFLKEERDKMLMKFLSMVFSLLKKRCLCVVLNQQHRTNLWMKFYQFKAPLEWGISRARLPRMTFVCSQVISYKLCTLIILYFVIMLLLFVYLYSWMGLQL